MNIHHKPHPWPTAPARETAVVDPIVLQIVEGTLNSIEAEIEYAIERTARSPMIREAHDYRPLRFTDAERRCARFSAADDAARRRIFDERYLSHRRQHRPLARSVQHRAGVS
jgi:hypothetical protein